MRIDQATTTTQPNPKAVATPAPKAEPRIKIAGDQLSIGAPAAPAEGQASVAKQGGNVLDDSVPRKAVDVVSAASGAADGARGIKPGADAIRLATEGGRLGGFGTRIAGFMDKVVGLGATIGGKLTWVVPLAAGLAKAAPLLGVFVATLDVGKSLIETDPDKKRKAQGMAVMSGISGLAGVVGFGAAAGATAFGIALAPLAVPALVIGVGVTALALADQFLFKGKVSKAIVSGFEAVGDGIGKAWSWLTR